MKQYLLSIYQPEGTPPSPEVLEQIMRDVGAVREEMKAAGAWVFSGGLNAPDTATVLRLDDSEVLMTDGPCADGYPVRAAPNPLRGPSIDSWAPGHGGTAAHQDHGSSVEHL